jgi:hypothetical protein
MGELSQFLIWLYLNGNGLRKYRKPLFLTGAKLRQAEFIPSLPFNY